MTPTVTATITATATLTATAIFDLASSTSTAVVAASSDAFVWGFLLLSSLAVADWLIGLIKSL